jgi:hypothetical protein
MKLSRGVGRTRSEIDACQSSIICALIICCFVRFYGFWRAHTCSHFVTGLERPHFPDFSVREDFAGGRVLGRVRSSRPALRDASRTRWSGGGGGVVTKPSDAVHRRGLELFYYLCFQFCAKFISSEN